MFCIISINLFVQGEIPSFCYRDDILEIHLLCAAGVLSSFIEFFDIFVSVLEGW